MDPSPCHGSVTAAIGDAKAGTSHLSCFLTSAACITPLLAGLCLVLPEVESSHPAGRAVEPCARWDHC